MFDVKLDVAECAKELVHSLAHVCSTWYRSLTNRVLERKAEQGDTAALATRLERAAVSKARTSGD